MLLQFLRDERGTLEWRNWVVLLLPILVLLVYFLAQFLASLGIAPRIEF